MTKKVFFMIMVLLMLLSLSACGDSATTAPVNSASVDSEQEHPVEDAIDAAEENAVGYYSNKVYYVGDDIPVGGYVLTCTGSDYGMQIIIFDSEQDYKDFQAADQFTVGEYGAAIEQHAWADFYLYQDEQAYIGLKKGNVILLDDGICEFTKFDPRESDTIYSGIYVVGKDIDPSKLDIKCIGDYLNITVFESRNSYLDYHKTSRFTIGEEADAIQAHAASTDFIYEGDSTYVNLQDGMILMVEDGTGEIAVDSGPVIH